MPTHLVAADLLSGHDVLISTGDLVDGVLASAAIPGILPPVERAGRHLVDGSVALHAGVAQAVDLGATLVYVLPTGAPCALPGPPRTAVGVALHSLTLLIAQRLIHEIAGSAAELSTIKILPPLCPLAVSAADFRHAAQLIARARRTSLEWISSGDIDLPARSGSSPCTTTARSAPRARDRPGAGCSASPPTASVTSLAPSVRRAAPVLARRDVLAAPRRARAAWTRAAWVRACG